QPVGAVLAVQPIVARIAVERIFARHAEQRVVAGPAVDVVVAVHTLDAIVARIAEERIIFRPADDDVVAVAAVDHARHGQGLLARHAFTVERDRVVAAPAVHFDLLHLTGVENAGHDPARDPIDGDHVVDLAGGDGVWAGSALDPQGAVVQSGGHDRDVNAS